jgi:hypothetical protein
MAIIMKRVSGLFVFIVFFVTFLSLVGRTPALAEGLTQGESFATPTYRDVVQAFLLMQGLDISNNKVADEYAKLSYCTLYQQKFHNDFAWNKIRAELINRAMQKHDYYRVQYQLEGTLYLGRFNFETQQFPLVKKSQLNHVGSFMAIDFTSRGLARPYRLCSTDYSVIFPGRYVFEINQPFTLLGLKVSQDEAKGLLDKMASLGNADRRLYIRFRYRAQTVDKLDPFAKDYDPRAAHGIFHGELTNVDLFLDHDMTKFYKSIPLK